MKTSICSIVKNEVEYLPRMMALFEPLADEFCIVDTGSTDGTLAITHPKLRLVKSSKYTAETHILDFDYGDARNHSLSLAQGEWILSIDSDYELEPSEVAELRLRIDGGRYDAFDMVFFSLDSGESRVCQPLFHRRQLGIRYKGNVHERMFYPPMARTHMEKDITFMHVRTRAVEGDTAFDGKRQRYMELLEKRLSDDPADDYAHYLLAYEYGMLKQWGKMAEQASIGLQNASSRLSTERNASCAPALMCCLGIGYANQGKTQAANGQFRMALRQYKHDPQLWFCLGELCRHTGKYADAKDAYEHAMQCQPPKDKFHRDFPEYRDAKPKEALALLETAHGYHG